MIIADLSEGKKVNSIEDKKNKTVHEAQFDKRLKNTKTQIEQILQGIEIKKHLGENCYCHHSCTKDFYIDEVIKYFEGKKYIVKLLPTESIVSYKINIIW